MRSGTYKIILKQLGSLFMMLGMIFILPITVSFIYAEWYSVIGFIISLLLVFLSGFLLHKFFIKAPDPQYNHGLILSAIAWLALTFMGGLPFFVISHITPLEEMAHYIPQGAEYTSSSLLYFRNYLHCFFESMSAFTTTGLTMVVHEPSVGKGILFYRSLAQWVGGAGFIVMALAIFKYESGRSVKLLYKSESTGISLKTKVMDTAKSIWKSYALITAITFVYLVIGTVIILPHYPFADVVFDAINHAMAGLSSGGFSTLDDSIATYHSVYMDYLYILPMILGSFSLPFYFRIFYQRKFREIWDDIQTRSLLICFFFGGIILSFLLLISGVVENPFREGVFQYISAISTTGWQTSNIHIWDNRSFLFIVFGAMVIGGAWGGTVGGIKIYRAVFIKEGLAWQIRKVFLSPNAIKTLKFDGRVMLPNEVNEELATATAFTLMFLLLILISTFISTFFVPADYTFFDALFEATSAQSTAGLSVGISNPSMHPVLESIYIFQMWAGRLELIPVLAFFRATFKGTKLYL